MTKIIITVKHIQMEKILQLHRWNCVIIGYLPKQAVVT